jgi:hypothetical protein
MVSPRARGAIVCRETADAERAIDDMLERASSATRAPA